MIHAILPAAGKSSRMGRPKLSLSIGSSTVLGCLVATLHQAGVHSVLVVLAPGDDRLATLASQSGAVAVHLPAPTPHMRATVSYGLNHLLESGMAKAGDAFMLIPADHPALTTRSLSTLLEAIERQHGYAVYVPTFEGKRGHPVILSYSIALQIPTLPESEGINQLIRRHEKETLQVPVDDPAILWDLDTEADYQRLRALFT